MYQFILRYVNSKTQEPEQMAGRVTGMILEGHGVPSILELMKDKKAFYTLTDEAIALIAANSK